MHDLALEVRGLTKSYGTGRHRQQVLFDVDLDVGLGEMVAIVGRSGCGKSTLLNIAGGLDRGDGGRVSVVGQDLATLDDRSLSRLRSGTIGFVFQQFQLLDHLSAVENVALPAMFWRSSSLNPRGLALQALERVGLADRAHDVAGCLSGGQKQRVAIARALFHRPSLLLCDEPTGNLDSATGEEIIELFDGLRQRDRIALVVVTHESRLWTAADRVLRMHDGRLLEDGAGVESASEASAVSIEAAPASLGSPPQVMVSTQPVASDQLRPARPWRLIGQNLRRNLQHNLLSAVGIIAGTAALAFFLGLDAGVRHVVLRQVFPVDRIEVVPPQATLFGEQTAITPDSIRRLRFPPADVGAKPRAVYPRMKLVFPARGWGGAALLGRNRDFYFDIGGFCDGVDPTVVRDDERLARTFIDYGDRGPRCAAGGVCAAGSYCAWDVYRCLRPVPALISPYLVEIYNGSIVPAHPRLPRMPSFAASIFAGQTFTVELGRSFLGSSAEHGKPVQRRFQLVGISQRAIQLGVTIPLGYVQRWNRLYAGKHAASSYSSAVVLADDHDITAMAAYAKRLGFDVVANQGEKVGLFITLATALFALISVVIVLVSAVNIAHTQMMLISERRREIGVLRAIGARRDHVAGALIGEAMVVGVVGGSLGLGLAQAAAAACDWVSAHRLPPFPFKPSSYFDFGPGIWIAGVLVAVACCALGSAWPAHRASRLCPAEALATR